MSDTWLDNPGSWPVMPVDDYHDVLVWNDCGLGRKSGRGESGNANFGVRVYSESYPPIARGRLVRTVAGLRCCDEATP